MKKLQIIHVDSGQSNKASGELGLMIFKFYITVQSMVLILFTSLSVFLPTFFSGKIRKSSHGPFTLKVFLINHENVIVLHSSLDEIGSK